MIHKLIIASAESDLCIPVLKALLVDSHHRVLRGIDEIVLLDQATKSNKIRQLAKTVFSNLLIPITSDTVSATTFIKDKKDDELLTIVPLSQYEGFELANLLETTIFKSGIYRDKEFWISKSSSIRILFPLGIHSEFSKYSSRVASLESLKGKECDPYLNEDLILSRIHNVVSNCTIVPISNLDTTDKITTFITGMHKSDVFEHSVGIKISTTEVESGTIILLEEEEYLLRMYDLKCNRIDNLVSVILDLRSTMPDNINLVFTPYYKGDVFYVSAYIDDEGNYYESVTSKYMEDYYLPVEEPEISSIARSLLDEFRIKMITARIVKIDGMNSYSLFDIRLGLTKEILLLTKSVFDVVGYEVSRGYRSDDSHFIRNKNNNKNLIKL